MEINNLDSLNRPANLENTGTGQPNKHRFPLWLLVLIEGIGFVLLVFYILILLYGMALGTATSASRYTAFEFYFPIVLFAAPAIILLILPIALYYKGGSPSLFLKKYDKVIKFLLVLSFVLMIGYLMVGEYVLSRK